MSTFASFPDIPGSDAITLCKLNRSVCHSDAYNMDITKYTKKTNNHPKINVIRDSHYHRAADENISLYVDVEDNLLKKITNVWFKQGFIEALNVASDPSVNRDHPVLAVTANYLLKVANALTSLCYILQPHLKDMGPKIVANFSRTRNWTNSPVKCMEWHPHTTKIAIVTADDNVRVYCSDVTFVSTLKCKMQGHVSSLSWRPNSVSELAVGCEQGVIVWTVDPNSMFTKPSSSNAVVLKRSGHTPVTDVSWSPNGDLLVSCSAADMSMLIWDVALESAVPLKRVAGGGVTFARWSYDASKIFAATSSVNFRIWDTVSWSPERWCVPSGGRVVASCWGPDGTLLCAPKGEPIVYSLSDTGFLAGTHTSKAKPILDLTKMELPSGYIVGGPVLDMCWDPNGQYLALLFEESPLIAIFNTIHMLTQLTVTPCCFVKGFDDELPTTMAFQRNFQDGACLSVAWSSGRLQHFPITFTEEIN